MRGKLLTIREVANHLRVSERSVLRYIEAGKLKATKIGYWRIYEKDLSDFINHQMNVKNAKRNY